MPRPYVADVRRLRGNFRGALIRGPLLLLGIAVVLGGVDHSSSRGLSAQPVASVLDLASAATYKVRTVLERPGSTPVERTATGVIAVPTLVDVDQPVLLGAPDLVVTLLPRLPLGLGVNISRAPLAQAKRVRAEIEIRLPNQQNTTVAFGYDARKDRSPKNFDADIQFGLQPGSTDLGLVTRITQPGTTLDLVGAVFSRPAVNGPRVDPTEFSLGATPVPAQISALAKFTPGLLAFADADDKNVDVDVTTSAPFHAVAKAATVRGDDTMDLDVDVPQLPTTLGLNYHTVKSTDLTEVTIDPAGGIPSATATYKKVDDAVATQTITAKADAIPSHAKLTIDGDELAAGAEGGYAEGAEREAVTWDANGSVERLQLTYDRTNEVDEPVHFEGTIDDLSPLVKATFDKVGANEDLVATVEAGEGQRIGRVLGGLVIGGVKDPAKAIPFLDTDAPAYASVDTIGAIKAAARIEGLTKVRVDTRNPFVVEAHTDTEEPQRFVAKHRSLSLGLDADVQHLPPDVTFTLTKPVNAPAPAPGPISLPSETIVAIDGNAPISHVDATIDTDPFRGNNAHIVGHIDDLPEDFSATIADGPGARKRVTWAASGDTGLVDADVVTTDATGAPVHLTALIEDLPKNLTFVFDKPNGDTFVEATAGEGQSVGLLDAGISVGDIAIPVRTEADYAEIATTDAGTAAAVRVHGLKHALLDTSEPFVLDVDLVEALTMAVKQTTPKRIVDVTIADVPTETHIEIANALGEDAKTTTITGDNNGPINAIDGGFTILGPRAMTGTLDLDKIPSDFTLTLTDSIISELNTIRWNANAVTEHVGVIADATTPTGEALHLDADVDGIPRDVVVTIEKLGVPPAPGLPDERGSRIVAGLGPTAQEGDAIGAIRAGVGKNGAAIPFRRDQAYVMTTSDGAIATAVNARITDVVRIAADTADPFDVDVVQKHAVPFVVDVDQPSLDLDAIITNLPTDAHVRLDLPDKTADVKTTVVHYDGNSVIGLVGGTFGVETDDGPFTGTFDLHDLPLVTDVVLTDDTPNEKLVVDYKGSAPIGLVHVNGTLAPPGEPTTTIDATIPLPPTDAVLTIDSNTIDDVEHTDLIWDANGEIERIDATVTTKNDDGLPLRLVAGVDDLPEDLTASFQKGDAGLVVDVLAAEAQTIGTVDAKLSVGGLAFPRLALADAANVVVSGDRLAVAARIHDLTHLLLDTREPLILDTRIENPVPFGLDVKTDDLEITDGRITNLPRRATVTFDRPDDSAVVKTTVLDYIGDPIGSIVLGAETTLDDGTFVDADVDLTALPSRMNVRIVDDPTRKAQEVHYAGGQIGIIDASVVLTRDGEVTRIDPVLEKVPGRVDVIVTRITTTRQDSTSVDYDADAPIGRLTVDVKSEEGTAHAVLTKLPTHIEIDNVVRKPLIVFDPFDRRDPEKRKNFTFDVVADGGIESTEVHVTDPGAGRIKVIDAIPGVLRHTDDATFARLPGIQGAHLRSTPLEAGLTLDPTFATEVPLDVFVDVEGVRVDGLIDALPNDADLVADFENGRITYTASEQIDHIDVVADAPPRTLFGKDGTFSRVTHAEVEIDDLPPGIAVGFGKLDEDSEGIDVGAFTPDPTTGEPPLDLELEDVDQPDFDKPSIGKIVLKAVEVPGDVALALPAPSIQFDETDVVRLFIALEDLQAAGISRTVTDDVTTNFASRTATTEAKLRLNPSAALPENPFVVQLDTFAKRLDGTPLEDCEVHTDVQVEGLPRATDIQLIAEERDVASGAEDCTGSVEAVRSTSEAKFSSKPDRIQLDSHRGEGDTRLDGATIDNQHIDITKVPTNFFACNAIYSGLCSFIEGSETVSGINVPFAGRVGSSLRLVSEEGMRIEEFEFCTTNGCNFDLASDTPEQKDDPLEFKRMYGIVIPDSAKDGRRLGFDLDTVEPALDNGRTLDRLQEVGMLHFDSDEATIIMESGEMQALGDEAECNNKVGDITRNGIGKLSGSKTEPFEWHSHNRILLFTASTLDGRDGDGLCVPLGFNCRKVSGNMAIIRGEMTASSLGAAGSLSSLNQELQRDRC